MLCLKGFNNSDNFMKLLVPMVFLFSTANAEDVTEELKRGLKQLAPTAQIKSNQSTPIKGISEVIIGNDITGEMYYMTNDGEYLIKGNIIETKTNANITENRKSAIRKDSIDQFDKSQRINFYPEDMKHHVTVFTDIDCGYCRKLHTQMAEYNNLGIGISYLMYPRSGIDTPSYDKAVTVWCSEDKNEAMTNAQNGINLDPIECENPIKDQYIAGQASGVKGTPNIVTDNGTLIPTYMPPDALLERLQLLESSQK